MQEGDIADTQGQIDTLKSQLRSWTIEYEQNRKEYESILDDSSQEQRINDLDHSLFQQNAVIEDLEKRYYDLKNSNTKSRH
jgi:hypothetical protein